MRRVLIGSFGPVARIGLRELLDAAGLETVAEAISIGQPLMALMSEARPDVVILDLDDAPALAMAFEITSTFPAVKVIACSSDEPAMRIFPPFHHGESYESELTPALLTLAVGG
jgi:DNA-binding NarL/FixJ family response regulator